MRNPFDKTFFRLVLGFSIILCSSFIIMFFTNKYSSILDEKQATVIKDELVQIKLNK
jgi:hypothetical protein